MQKKCKPKQDELFIPTANLATGPGHPHTHTGWEEAEALAARHPGTRFLFNHVYAGELTGAVHDLDVVDV